MQSEVYAHPVSFGYTVVIGLTLGFNLGYLDTAQQIFQYQYAQGSLFPFY
jgi:hypothetical protein